MNSIKYQGIPSFPANIKTHSLFWCTKYHQNIKATDNMPLASMLYDKLRKSAI